MLELVAPIGFGFSTAAVAAVGAVFSGTLVSMLSPARLPARPGSSKREGSGAVPEAAGAGTGAAAGPPTHDDYIQQQSDRYSCDVWGSWIRSPGLQVFISMCVSCKDRPTCGSERGIARRAAEAPFTPSIVVCRCRGRCRGRLGCRCRCRLGCRCRFLSPVKI